MSKFTSSPICPQCGTRMERIRRKTWHRLLSFFVPVKHVWCCNKSYLLVCSSDKNSEDHQNTDSFIHIRENG